MSKLKESPRIVRRSGSSIKLNIDQVTDVLPVSELKKWKLIRKIDDELLKKIRLVHVFGDSAVFVTSDDQAYHVGGRLTGEDPPPNVILLTKMDQLCDKKIKDLFCFNQDLLAEYGKEQLHSSSWFAIGKTGIVYSWGNNLNGSCGHGHTDPVSAPTVVNALHQHVIKSVAGGGKYVVVLNQEGQLFHWGDRDDDWPSVPEKITATIGRVKIMTISCGQEHAVALSELGEVFVWKTGTAGRNQRVPCRILLQNTSPISKIACGAMHTVAVSEGGEIFTWGMNVTGQLGIGSSGGARAAGNFLTQPREVHKVSLKHVDQIAVCSAGNLNACRTKTKLHVWGEILGKGIIASPMEACGAANLHEVFVHYFKPQCMPVAMKAKGRGSSGPEGKHLTIAETLKESFLDQSDPNMDITFMVEDVTIKAHKAILQLRSQYFQRMFGQQMWTESNGIIRVGGDFKYETFRAMLHYLYTDEIPPTMNTYVEIMDLVVLSDFYCESFLKQKCSSVLKQNMNVDNALEIYSAASKCNAEELQKVTFQFILDNCKKFDSSKLEDSDLTRADLVKLSQQLAKRRRLS